MINFNSIERLAFAATPKENSLDIFFLLNEYLANADRPHQIRTSLYNFAIFKGVLVEEAKLCREKYPHDWYILPAL